MASPQLAFSVLEPPHGESVGAFVFLHGILGTRANWRGFARRMMAKRPGLSAVLVDLRMHGESRDFPPPHEVGEAARDVVDLVRRRRVPRILGLVGHSFGGTVALSCLFDHQLEVGELWVVDAPIGAVRGEGVTAEVLRALHAIGPEFATREAFVAALAVRGIDEATARWLAMSLRADTRGVRFGPDLAAIDALVTDFRARDFWSGLLQTPPTGARHLVVGARSTALDESERARVSAHSREAGLSVHVVADAGHWVHVDQPGALLGLMAPG